MIGVAKTKKLKHAIGFYKSSFSLHPPYLIVCEGNFLFAALDKKINILQQLTDAFKGKVYLKITTCTLQEVDKLKQKEFNQLKRFAHNDCQRFKCSHGVMNAPDCIMDLLKHGFVGGVGTQDITLRRRIHANYPEIPVFFINKTLQICRPPESLRKKVNKELIDKYAPKTLNKEEEITIEQKAVDDDGDEQKSQENENISDNNESDKE